MARDMDPLCPHVGPREGRCEVATSDFLPMMGKFCKTGHLCLPQNENYATYNFLVLAYCKNITHTYNNGEKILATNQF